MTTTWTLIEPFLHLYNEEAVEIGHIEFALEGKTCRLLHTVAEEGFRSMGVAKLLMDRMVEVATERHWTLIPICSYSQVYLQRRESQTPKSNSLDAD